MARVVVSLIVPVYEQWDLVPQLLSALEAQNLPSNQWEALFVDNGSKRPLRELVESRGYQYLECAEPGSYAARNYALTQAQGGLVVFTDADCIPCPAWLGYLYDAFCRGGDRFLYAGSVTVPRPEPIISCAQLYDVALGIPQERYVSRGHAATANLAIPSSVLQLLGGFEAARKSGGDTDFCKRAASAGFGLLYVPQAEVLHPPRSDMRQLITKARRLRGGKIANGPFTKRIRHAVGTILPPVEATGHILKSQCLSKGEKLIVLNIRYLLWFYELLELFRLSLGGAPERR